MYLSLEILMTEAPFVGVLNEDFEKCPFCECYFFTEIDMKKHLNKFGREEHTDAFMRLHRKVDVGSEEETEQTAWHKAKFGTGEITLSANDAALTRSIDQNGEVRMGMYRYTLSNDKKWIIRKIVSE